MRDRDGPVPLGQSGVLAMDCVGSSEARVKSGRTGSNPEGRKIEKQGKGCR